MKVINVVGARPNFMKIAPIINEMKKHPEIEPLLVHTEQHYDENMSKLFFDDLGLPKPDIFLGVGSGSHAEQTAKVMLEFEKVLVRYKPNLTLVVGDVNSTIACALTSAKLNIPVAHVEAGLRSFDKTMPEEINRILTDAISDHLFVTEKSGEINLIKEGIPQSKIHFVGNVMIDTLLKHKEKANGSHILTKLHLDRGSKLNDTAKQEFVLVTLHRPSNVDNIDNFVMILEALNKIRERVRIVYPMHPRTRSNIIRLKLFERYPFLLNNHNGTNNDFIVTEPFGYLDFIKLISESVLVITDSGGIQEETTVLQVPCLTVRENTERPVTCEKGTNILVGMNTEKIIDEALKVLNGNKKIGQIPDYWDGFAAERIVQILLNEFLRKA